MHSRRPGDRVNGSPYLYPVLAAIIAVGGALATTTLDAVVHIPWLPWLPRAGRASAQALLGGVAGGMITAAAVLFWIRGMLVQLAAGQFSSRILQPYLDSRFQRALMGFTIATFVFCVVALLALPEASEGGRAAPLLTLGVASLLATGVLLAIVAAIANTVRTTRIEEIVRAVTDETLVALRRLHPPRGEGHRPQRLHDGSLAQEEHLVRAAESGWVRHVDGEAIRHVLAEGATARLQARVGDFVAEGMPLCSLAPAPHDAAAVTNAVRGAVTLGRQRSRDGDVVLGIRELVDVAASSLAPGSPDSTAGLETLSQLGAVTRELLLRDLPQVEWTDDTGRCVLQPRALSFEDYVDLVFARIRSRHAGDLTTAVALLTVLGQVCQDVERHGDVDRAALLRGQAALVLEGFAASDPLADDLECVRRVAAEYGFARGVAVGQRPSWRFLSRGSLER